MTREWKPGDVALVNDCTQPDKPWRPATCKEARRPGQSETVWILHDNGSKVWGSVSDARPLVVIDPEDREQVERLRDSLISSASIVDMQAALREFANPTPPKPDEPLGLGAVVEDARSVIWIRADGADLPWLNSESSGDYWLSYADIAAVRVLSEGVS